MLISSRSASNQLQKSSFATQEGKARLLLRQVFLYLWLTHPLQSETSSKQGCENICQVVVYRRIRVSTHVTLECLHSISEGEGLTLTLVYLVVPFIFLDIPKGILFCELYLWFYKTTLPPTYIPPRERKKNHLWISKIIFLSLSEDIVLYHKLKAEFPNPEKNTWDSFPR